MVTSPVPLFGVLRSWPAVREGFPFARAPASIRRPLATWSLFTGRAVPSLVLEVFLRKLAFSLLLFSTL